jgi:uncharacterized protein YdaU (DUF1376 family)
MHYYKRNLGDYAKKAGRLTMLQHGAYTLLIDSCYDREVFPTLEQALEWTWASTEAEVEAVKFVLSRFFVLDKEGCYVQDRILQELLHYHKNADTNKRIADEREAKRKENRTKRVQSVDEAPPNHKPLTTNHKPIKNTATSVATPEGVSDSVWQEFKSLRKAKKAPITQRAIDALTIEANKAGWTLEKALEECVVRGWQAFKADWVATKANPADNIRLTVPASNEPDPALLKIKQDEKITRPPTPEELAIFNSIRRKA